MRIAIYWNTQGTITVYCTKLYLFWKLSTFFSSQHLHTHTSVELYILQGKLFRINFLWVFVFFSLLSIFVLNLQSYIFNKSQRHQLVADIKLPFGTMHLSIYLYFFFCLIVCTFCYKTVHFDREHFTCTIFMQIQTSLFRFHFDICFSILNGIFVFFVDIFKHTELHHLDLFDFILSFVAQTTN